MKSVGASNNLSMIIEGENLLNDGTAMVTFFILLRYAKGEDPTLTSVVGNFV
jgi:NhaP-type Na+/H+ or K+/H+ antiporter